MKYIPEFRTRGSLVLGNGGLLGGYDGIAFDDDNKTLIMEIYDHLHFEGKFEFDHIVILQDKLNTYLWYIESKQYADIYPDKQFDNFVINIHFRYEITENCKKYINVSNQKLSVLNIKIVSYLNTIDTE